MAGIYARYVGGLLSGGISSINSDTTPNQLITGGTDISVSTSGGDTVITYTGGTGSAITSLTGDVTAMGPGAAAASLVATSNATLTTLSALTTASSLSSIGTVTSGTWHGTAVGAQYGGTGIDTHSSTGYPSLSSGTWSIVSASTLTAALSVFTSGAQGVVGASGGGTTNFLRADGTWAAPTGTSGITALTGDVTASGPGSATATLAATSNATLTTLSGLTTASSLSTIGTIGTGVWHGTAVGAQYGGTGLDTHTSTGFPSLASGTWSVITAATLTSDLNLFTALLQGMTPASGGGTTNYLRADGTWAAPPGTAGANTTLSNLGTTSINSSLIPDGVNTLTVGSPSFPWLGLYCNNLYTVNISNYFSAGINLGDTSSSCYLYDESGTNQLQWGSGGITLGQLSTWSSLYLGASSVVHAAALGAAGTVLTSNGTTSAPTYQVPATFVYYSGSMSSSNDWTNTSATYASLGGVTANTITTLFSSGLSVAGASGVSNPLAITFTPGSATAVYHVTVVFPGELNTASAVGSFRITDGTTAFCSASIGNSGSATVGNPGSTITLSGLYASGGTSAVTLAVQGQTSAGAIFVNGNTNAGPVWTLIQLHP